MELVKRIKTAESDAAKLITDANNDVASDIEKANIQQGLKFSESELERTEIIDGAIEKSVNAATVQANGMQQEAKKQCSSITSQIDAKLANASAKVIEYIMDIPSSQHPE